MLDAHASHFESLYMTVIKTLPPTIDEMLQAINTVHLIFSEETEMTDEEIELMQNIADSNSHHPVDCLGIGIQMGMIVMQQRFQSIIDELEGKHDEDKETDGNH